MKKPKPKEKWFEVGVPVREVWIFHVKAKDKREALKRVKDHHTSVDQVCSVAGSVGYVIELDQNPTVDVD